MKKSFLVGGVLVFLLVILGIYLFTRGNESNNLNAQKSKLQNDLALAQNKLSKEKQTLKTMTGNFQSSFAFAVGIQDQMKKVNDMVERTDFMFTNPNSLNPDLIVKNLSNDVEINNKRRDVNSILSSWQKKTDILSVKEIDRGGSEQIQKDTETIKIFIEDLSQIVKNLTPENSGLSQFQINTYSAQFPSSEDIDEILVSLENTIENSNNNSNSLLDTPVVSPEDVIAEQALVAEVQNQVADLQEQLAQVEEQLGQPSSVPPIPISTENNITTNPNLENQNTDNDTSNLTNEGSNDNTNFEDIIIQPGPPRLIEGANQY